MNGIVMATDGFLDDQAFQAFRSYIYDLTGIDYTDNKRYMLDVRIKKRALENGCADAKSYLALLRSSTNQKAEIDALIDEVSIHETSFFRHKNQVDIFAKLLHEIIEDHGVGSRPLTMWSTACSSGEEPFTLAMVAHDILKDIGWSANLKATDISAPTVASARQGRYNRRYTGGIPEPYFSRYLKPDSAAEYYNLTPEIMRMVNFDVLSLVDEAKMKTMRNMDMVFCRNVLIYFDNDVKKKVLNSLFQSLKPGGYLVLGPSDSLHGLNNDFQRTPYSAFNFYQRPAASRPAASKSTAPGFAPAVKPPLAVTTPVAPSSTLQPGQNFRVKMLVNRLNNGLRDLSGDVDTSLTKTIDSFGGISQTLETIQKAEDLPSKVRSELNAVNRQIARILVYMQVGDRAQQKSEAMRGLLQELSDRIFGTDKEAPDLGVQTTSYDSKILADSNAEDAGVGDSEEMSQDDTDALFS